MHHFRSFSEATDDADEHTVFNFNSDMSGNVIIAHRGQEIEVPGEHLLQFVANYIRQERIASLEQANDRQIFGIAP